MLFIKTKIQQLYLILVTTFGQLLRQGNTQIDMKEQKWTPKYVVK